MVGEAAQVMVVEVSVNVEVEVVVVAVDVVVVASTTLTLVVVVVTVLCKSCEQKMLAEADRVGFLRSRRTLSALQPSVRCLRRAGGGVPGRMPLTAELAGEAKAGLEASRAAKRAEIWTDFIAMAGC